MEVELERWRRNGSGSGNGNGDRRANLKCGPQINLESYFLI